MNRLFCTVVAVGVFALSSAPSSAVTVDLGNGNVSMLEANLPLGQNSGDLPPTFNSLAGSFSDGWDFTSKGTSLDFTIKSMLDVSDLKISLFSFAGDGPFPIPATLVASTTTDALVANGLTDGGFYFIELTGLGQAANSSVDANLTATPLPATLPLYGAGIGVVGLLGWRRKRQSTASTSAGA